MTVNNATNCQKVLPPINVPASIFQPITVTVFTKADAVCNQNNAFVRITSFSANNTFYNFSWMDSVTNQIVGAGAELNNVAAGTYQLVAVDSNGCSKKIFSAILRNRPIPVFDYTQVIQKNDQCNLSEGRISSIKVNNLIGPTTYAWYNSNNEVVGTTLNLIGLKAGEYVLKVNDATYCNLQSTVFIVSNSNNNLSQPSYDNLVIPRYSNAQLRIKNPPSGNYLLQSNTSGNILQQNTNGNFNINNISSDTSFYVTLSLGTCRSTAAKINVSVLDKSFFAIPTAFTPNGDGVNDRLNVRVIGYLKLVTFKIYNKWGEQVFETNKLNEGWNGIHKGLLQNTGSYVWLAEGKDITGKTIKEKGYFTLLR